MRPDGERRRERSREASTGERPFLCRFCVRAHELHGRPWTTGGCPCCCCERVDRAPPVALGHVLVRVREHLLDLVERPLPSPRNTESAFRVRLGADLITR